MTASTWPVALAFVWRPENDGERLHTDAGDSGGATNRGVTHVTWDTAVEQGLVSGSLVNATDDQLGRILHVMFWNAVRGDELATGVDLAVFNLAMVAGSGRAAFILQGIVGADQDYQIGGLTVAASRRFNPEYLIERFTDQEEAFYAHLDNAWRFGNGWKRRAEDCRIASCALIGLPAQLGPPTPVSSGDSSAGLTADLLNQQQLDLL